MDWLNLNINTFGSQLNNLGIRRSHAGQVLGSISEYEVANAH